MNNEYEQHFRKVKQSAGLSPKVKVANSNRIQPKKKSKPFPIATILFAGVILCGSTWLYLNIESVETWLSKVEVRLFGSAVASEETKQNLPIQPTQREKKSPEQTDGQALENSATRNLTPEELALFNKLEERRVELDKRETDLKKLDEELQQQKLMLEGKMKALEEVRTNIASQLDDRVKADETQVEKLVAMYANMKPQRAAKVLETVNEDLAVEVLRNMKRDKAADILNMLDSAKAQKLSEKFAGYRKD